MQKIFSFIHLTHLSAASFGVQCSNVRNRKKKNLLPCGKRFSFYAPAGIRTLDTRLKRAVLYLLSYWGTYSWDGGTRTHYIGVKVRCVTITLHPNIMAIQAWSKPDRTNKKEKGGIWGSNPRHPEPQSGALPTELIPPYDIIYKLHAETVHFGTPRGIRTPDLLLRRQLLYPAELLPHIQLSN